MGVTSTGTHVVWLLQGLVKEVSCLGVMPHPSCTCVRWLLGQIASAWVAENNPHLLIHSQVWRPGIWNEGWGGGSKQGVHTAEFLVEMPGVGGRGGLCPGLPGSGGTTSLGWWLRPPSLGLVPPASGSIFTPLGLLLIVLTTHLHASSPGPVVTSPEPLWLRQVPHLGGRTWPCGGVILSSTRRFGCRPLGTLFCPPQLFSHVCETLCPLTPNCTEGLCRPFPKGLSKTSRKPFQVKLSAVTSVGYEVPRRTREDKRRQRLDASGCFVNHVSPSVHQETGSGHLARVPLRDSVSRESQLDLG